jgi:hypothetical protein
MKTAIACLSLALASSVIASPDISMLGDNKSMAVAYLPSPGSVAEEACHLTNVILYNSDEQLTKRGFDPEAAADYIKRLDKTASSVLAGSEKQDACGLLIAIGIKPGKKVRVWCEAVEGSLSDELLNKLAVELEKIPTLEIKKGPVAFALSGALWGRAVRELPRMPSSWAKASAASKKELSVPDGLFKVIWRD